jgi:DNA polymerase-3 subunit alpha
LRKEFAAIGFYLTAHPLDVSAKPLERLKVIQYAALAQAVRNSPVTRFKLAGVVIAKQERTSQRGKRFAFLTLSDVSGIYEVTIFSELLADYRALMEPGQLLVIEVDAQVQEEGIRLTAQGIQPLDRAIASVVTGLRIVVDETADIEAIRGQLQPQPAGRSRIVVAVRLSDRREARITLPPAWSITGKAHASLETMPGVLELEDL